MGVKSGQTGTPVSEVDPQLAAAVAEIANLNIFSDENVISSLNELSKLPSHSELLVEPKLRKIQPPDVSKVVEDQELIVAKNFLTSFKEAKAGMTQLKSELTKLNGVCDTMVESLSASKQNSRNLIDEIAKLEHERKKLCKERQLAQAYLNAFQLNGEDVRVLKSTDHTQMVLSAEFFTVFEKIQRIQKNVQLLMNLGHQTTAVEILDQMGLFQETALEKIYRWSQTHCKGVENPDLADILCKCMAYLQVRPMLQKYVLDEYCTHRRSLLVRNFIDALTGVGNIKGIEQVGTTDPARYVGDMLAWIHQSVPYEKENLSLLLKSCDEADKNEKVISALAAIVDGVCRPFNVRMEQTLLSGYDCITMSKLDMRIKYYVEIIGETIPGSQLYVTLKELQTLCNQTFLNQLKAQVASELSEYRPPGPDLSPPSTVSSLLLMLAQLLEESKDNPEYMQTLMHLVVTPLAAQVNAVANKLGSPDSGVYLCNCLQLLTSFLEPYPNTGMIYKALKGQIDTQTDRLASEQSSWLVAQLGIGHIYTILHEKFDEALSTVPGMDPSSLKIFLNKLDNLMVDADSVLLPQIIHINDSEIKAAVQKQSFRILVVIYKKLYDAVADPKNTYEPTLLGLTPEKLEEELCGPPGS